MGISLVEAAPDNFVHGRFPMLWDDLQKQSDQKKLSRLDLERHSGAFEGFLNGFHNDLDRPLCPFCGKRPADREAGRSKIVGTFSDISICRVCRDHIFIGTNLVKNNRLAILKEEASLEESDNRLMNPVFDRYQLSFQEDDLNDSALKGELIRYWDLSHEEKTSANSLITNRSFNGYLPCYSEEDNQTHRYDKGSKSENQKLELIEQIKIGDPKTLSHIAAWSKNEVGDDKYQGIEALGVLKADIDNLGMLMSCGLKEQNFTLSRLSSLSRQFNNFFVVYLPHLLRAEPTFQNTYTVFAGGDDLFLIGPWNRIIELAGYLRAKFREYVCHNEEIHFSAGISIHDSHEPIDSLAETAETALEHSKDADRNRITLFSETVHWDEAEELNLVKIRIQERLEKEHLNKALLYRLNELIRMVGEEQRLIKAKEVNVNDMACTRWRALLAYGVARNVGKTYQGDEKKQIIEEVHQELAYWLTKYGTKMKIPLWDILYNIRR